MRRVGTVLLSAAAALLALPVPAAGAVDCAVSTLPNLPGAAGGSSAATVLDNNTILGWANDPYEGVIWRNGVVSRLNIIANEVNTTGFVAGSVYDGQGRAARAQLGGTPQIGSTSPSGLDDVNAAGDSVGWQSTGFPPNFDYDALWWKRGEAAPRLLPGPASTTAGSIDDLGNIVGVGDTFQGERRWLIWGPDGTIKRQYGPYADGQTVVAPTDIDNGIAVADRYPATGDPDIALINVSTGAITPIAGSRGWIALQIHKGTVLAQDSDITLTYRLWHNGATYNLPTPPGEDPNSSRLFDLKVLGSTAVVVGLTWHWNGSRTVQIPTVWRCG